MEHCREPRAEPVTLRGGGGDQECELRGRRSDSANVTITREVTIAEQQERMCAVIEQRLVVIEYLGLRDLRGVTEQRSVVRVVVGRRKCVPVPHDLIEARLDG